MTDVRQQTMREGKLTHVGKLLYLDVLIISR